LMVAVVFYPVDLEMALVVAVVPVDLEMVLMVAVVFYPVAGVVPVELMVVVVVVVMEFLQSHYHYLYTTASIVLSNLERRLFWCTCVWSRV